MARLAELCEAGGLGPGAAAEAEAVFAAIARDGDRDLRAGLAHRLARARWAPQRLVEALADDDIEVARPIIAESPLLTDEAQLRLVAKGSIGHRIELARRPRLSARVAAALIDRGEPAVLTALAGNRTADVTPAQVARLVDRAKTIAALGAPLAAHPRMTGELAQSLYLWVDPTLRASIVARFDLDAAWLDAQVAAVMSEPANTPRLVGPTAAESKLVAKLAASGRLSAGYLVRALRDHQLGVFEAALAKIGGFTLAETHQAVADPERPELLALALAAVGVDRSAFPSILEMVRQCTDGLPGGGAEGARRALSAFGPFSADVAARAFRNALGQV
jgi:uncharacterized protein (DUF2336 family)